MTLLEQRGHLPYPLILFYWSILILSSFFVCLILTVHPLSGAMRPIPSIIACAWRMRYKSPLVVISCPPYGVIIQ